MPFGTVRLEAPCSEPPTSSSLFSDSHLEDPEDASSSCYTPATELTKRSTFIPLAVSMLDSFRQNRYASPKSAGSCPETSSRTDFIQSLDSRIF